MSKQRPPEIPAAAPAGRPSPPPAEKKAPRPKTSPWAWGPARRAVVSFCAVAHLMAVFIAPWALGLRTQEPYVTPLRDAQGRTIPEDRLTAEQVRDARVVPVLAEKLYRFFAHYNDLLYTNGGYEYFTPDPTWAHILRYEIFDAENRKIAEGRMPDTHYQWPRLFYHRHMMLIEQTLELPNSDRYVADWLLRRHDGRRIHMQLIRHHLLTPREVLAGKKLDDPSTYEVVGEQDQLSDAPKAGPLPPPPPVGVAPETISAAEGLR